MCHQESVDFIL
jgi:hypothetical protein